MWIHSRIQSSRDLSCLQFDRTKQETFVFFSFFLFCFTRIYTNYTRAAFVEEGEIKIKVRTIDRKSKPSSLSTRKLHLAHGNFSRLHPRRNSRLGIEQRTRRTYASREWLRKWELRRLEEGNCNGRWMEEQSQPRIYNAARHNISQANQLA